MQLCWCFGGRTYDAEGNAAFDNEGNVAGFAYINAMYNEHKIIEGRGRERRYRRNNKAYQSGQVAFINNPASVSTRICRPRTRS